MKVSPGKDSSPSKSLAVTKIVNSERPPMDAPVMKVKVSPGKQSPSSKSLPGKKIANSEHPPSDAPTNRGSDCVNQFSLVEDFNRTSAVSNPTNVTDFGTSPRSPTSQHPTPREDRRSLSEPDSDTSTGTITPQSSPNATLPPNAVPYYDNYTLYRMLTDRNKTIDEMEAKIGRVEQKLEFLHSLLNVKDSVLRGVQNELHRLQQYTRRYSVSIAGIPKQRGEKTADLRKSVEDIINAAQSTTTPLDIDKLHRNGPVYGQRGANQDTIVRFKSHSAKEAFYRARKSLPEEMQHVKIRPSLSEAQKNLLTDAKDYLKMNSFEGYGNNPPDFVFANIHGNIQVKMKKQSKYGLFIDIKSVAHLAQVIARANDSEQSIMYHHEKQSSWDDDVESGSDDDMGFGLFD